MWVAISCFGSAPNLFDQTARVVQRIVVLAFTRRFSVRAETLIGILRTHRRREFLPLASRLREQKSDGCPSGRNVEFFEQIQNPWNSFARSQQVLAVRSVRSTLVSHAPVELESRAKSPARQSPALV